MIKIMFLSATLLVLTALICCTSDERIDCLFELNRFDENGSALFDADTMKMCALEYQQQWHRLTLDQRHTLLIDARKNKLRDYFGLAMQTIFLTSARPKVGTYFPEEYEVLRISSINYVSDVFEDESVPVLIGAVHLEIDPTCIHAAKKLLEIEPEIASIEIESVLDRYEKKLISASDERFVKMLSELR